jgi:hypothetical protein
MCVGYPGYHMWHLGGPKGGGRGSRYAKIKKSQLIAQSCTKILLGSCEGTGVGGGDNVKNTILRSSSAYSLADLASYVYALSVQTKATNIP